MRFIPVDGNHMRLDGGAMFGNAPKEMWKRWIEPDEKNCIPLSTRCLLVQGERNILFEAGVGAFFEPKLAERYGVVEKEHVLLRNLGKLGLSHEDIDIIVLSHLHFDHIGGLLSAHGDGEPRLLFPNATIYTGKTQWEHAQKPHRRDRASYVPITIELLKSSGKVKLIDAEEHPDIPEVKRFYMVSGHTPGQILSELDFEGRPLIFTGDLIPGSYWVHLPIAMGYDRFPEGTVDEKADFLPRAFERQALLFFTHDPYIAIASLMQEQGRFQALEYQLI